jgi:hypothetical protein
MAASITLPAGWGEAHLCSPGEHRPKNGDTARAYDHLSWQLAWAPAGRRRFACDVEHADRSCREMAERFGMSPERFRCCWVATEVVAKLMNVPVLQWVKKFGLVTGEFRGARILLVEELNRVMAFGFLP